MARDHDKTLPRNVGRLAWRVIRQYWGVVLIVVVWELWVVLNDFNAIVMPRPWPVVVDVVKGASIYFPNAAQTLVMALAGLVIGMVLGTTLAVAAWWSSLLSGLITPLSLVFSSVPVVAIIPVLARIFGYDVRTVLAIVVIITFFPAFVFTSSGLRATPPGSEDLFGVLGASRVTRLIRLALPAAVPNWMIALRLCAPQAILAAMIAEFLMGTSGLGYLFNAAKTDFEMNRALGTSLVATVVSVTCFVAAVAAERRVRERWT